MEELTKPQKKKVRELIDRALEREFKEFLLSVRDLVADVETTNSLSDMYSKLYDSFKAFDKRLSMRYGDIRGSQYFNIILWLFIEKKLTLEDISEFDDEMRDGIVEKAKMWE